ncbi:hypothetical protein HYH02_005146 [Chlamydomonas schloesseri]|uniref:Glycosyl transferase CAP10 domain-containing protein n=1 Tax=Chlamydomonas schloesseri TaxID=2026947 RepID=A0A835WLU8_9CHLO|nr:hypothetical protein HYH02_005146 [Chlamydomonas schloesseri]|eukprot:KAG2449613.1 hypothetical protein HYH02_005146 [Chlamydomonas schloesseri]
MAREPVQHVGFGTAAKAPPEEELRKAGRAVLKARKGRIKRTGGKGAGGHGGRPGAAGSSSSSSGVQQVPLDEYDWRETERSMEELLDPALGREVRYWRSRPAGISCDDLAAEVVRLHAKSLVYVRTVLIRNNRWYFLNPVGFSVPADAARANPGAVPGSRWPLLEATRRCSHYCHYQMSSLWLGVKQLMDAARASNGSTAAVGPYSLPDMLFVLNVADNSPSDQHYGRLARAPILSLLKKWDEPWWQPAARNSSAGAGSATAGAAGSLGRLPGGQLLQRMPLPSRVRERVAALDQLRGSGGSSDTLAAGSVALPLLETPADGRADASAVWEDEVARSSSDPLRELVRGFVARMPAPPAAAVAEAQAAAAAGETAAAAPQQRRKPTDTDLEYDLLLPVMHYNAQSLSFVPWANKTDKAFFSGSAFREKYRTTHAPLSVRPHVGALAARHPADLDVRLRGLGQKTTVGWAARMPPVPITEHATYRWLLAMDGVSAFSRMGLLMGLDSVLLKSRSPYIEYYSRLQVPGVHYLEFWTDPTDPDDLLRVLAAARVTAREDPAGLRAAVQANQALAARYNARLPRQIYARAALLAYRELIPDMDECVDDLLRHMRRTGHEI